MNTFNTVDDYIAAQSASAQPRLRELRKIICTTVPEASEVISYGMPTYRLGGERVHFGAARGHCALYGAPIAEFADALREYRTLKGTVQFPLDRPVPEELVGKMVAAKFASVRA